MALDSRQSGGPKPSSSPLFVGLCLLVAAGFVASPYLVFVLAPTEPVMGFIQKIFYYHVPCAWSMLLGALLSAVGGAAYLARSRRWGDALCIAAAELTVLFGITVMITGPLWAKKAWGHYWVWEARLTTMLVLFLIFCGVLLARRYGGSARRRIAAGLAIFGAADVPLIYISVKLWRTVHPPTGVVRTLPTEMKLAFVVSLVTFTALFVLLLWVRMDLQRDRQRLDRLWAKLAERD